MLQSQVFLFLCLFTSTMSVMLLPKNYSESSHELKISHWYLDRFEPTTIPICMCVHVRRSLVVFKYYFILKPQTSAMAAGWSKKKPWLVVHRQVKEYGSVSKSLTRPSSPPRTDPRGLLMFSHSKKRFLALICRNRSL